MVAGPKFKPHPQSAPGDFYVENGQCLARGVPHVVAPDLVGWADEKVPHCIWKKQPQTPSEYERVVSHAPSYLNSLQSSRNCWWTIERGN